MGELKKPLVRMERGNIGINVRLSQQDLYALQYLLANRPEGCPVMDVDADDLLRRLKARSRRLRKLTKKRLKNRASSDVRAATA